MCQLRTDTAPECVRCVSASRSGEGRLRLSQRLPIALLADECVGTTMSLAGADERMRVLIVDDEEPLRKLLRHWIEAEGATVVEPGTAEEGLALAQAGGAPAVALCDIRLPGNDGLWLADQLRAGFPETVVLMTTGVLEFNAAVHSLQSGVADYLVKPFPRDRLTDALRRACFVHRSRRSVTDMQRELDERRAQIAAALDDLEINAAASLEAMLAMLRVRDAILRPCAPRREALGEPGEGPVHQRPAALGYRACGAAAQSRARGAAGSNPDSQGALAVRGRACHPAVVSAAR